MYNFFIESSARVGDICYLGGGDFNHVKNVLRMKVGDRILISVNGDSALCEIVEYTESNVVARVVEDKFQDTSLPISITLFQGLPKSDKLELIIQKAVELGADKIVPVEMARSIVKLDDKKKKDKVKRWQAIAESAAKQSKRAAIPSVGDVLSFNNAVKSFSEYDLVLLPYECKDGMNDTTSALKKIKSGMKIAVLIGPEGGFDLKEVVDAENGGAKTISLGKRILRTETAAITALSMLMLYAEINL